MTEFYIVGGANIDLCGKSNKPLQQFDSNPGKITLSYGGVGRNIAENLVRLQQKVHFISVLGYDPYGDLLNTYCESIGMDMKYCKRAKAHGTSTYLAILDEKQDMVLAISDMEILQEMDEVMLNPMLDALKCDDVLIVDTNLDQHLLHYMTDQARCTIALDPISAHKAEKVKEFLGKFDIIKPNIYEAEVLWGHPIKNEDDLQKALSYFINLGVKEVIISMSSQGVAAAKGKERVIITHPSVEVVNATGGGDCFLGAYLSVREKMSLVDAVEFACVAAINTICCNETVDSTLNEAKILELKKQIKMERKINHVHSC